MENTNSYQIITLDIPQFSTVKMFKNALGGNDAMQFSSAIRTIIGSKTEFLIVDMQNLEIMNSSGLGMLVGALSTLKKENIGMVLCNVPNNIYELIKMTHLDKVFKIYDDIEKAVNQLS